MDAKSFFRFANALCELDSCLYLMPLTQGFTTQKASRDKPGHDVTLHLFPMTQGAAETSLEIDCSEFGVN